MIRPRSFQSPASGFESLASGADGKIKVLVADDSQVMRMLLVHLLNSDPQVRVIGAVHDGQEALEFVLKNAADVVLMDLHMPGLDGFEATRRIMEKKPVPIVICSATADPRELMTTFRALEAGAVACIAKPIGSEHAEFESRAANLVQTVKLMSEVRVVRRWPRIPAPPRAAVKPLDVQHAREEIKIIGIGTSTGGPPVLQIVLAGLPKDFSVPILIVQHIARGFLPGMSEWLKQTTGLQVQIGSYGLLPLPGHVYLAPDDFHMGIGSGGQIILTREEPENGLRPAVSFLFRSLADAVCPNALGVLLTGMGKDGAAELKLMRDRGAVTIAQDQETSVVNGMPGEAVALDAATHVLPADRISSALISIVNRGNGK